MTRSMTRWMLAGLIALVAVGVVGAPAQADPPANPFAGSWSGTWSHVEDDDFGTWDWTISDAGRIKGTGRSIPNNFGVTIVGHVGADGNLALIAGVPNDVPAGGSGYPSQGTAVIDGDGKLVVSFSNTWSGGISGVGILERN